MSILTDFVTAAAAIASEIIGTEPITIGGGSAVQGVMNEAAFSREYEAGGFDQTATLDVVIAVSIFSAIYPESVKSYEGKAATARGESWRVGRISKGVSFVQISLISSGKSA